MPAAGDPLESAAITTVEDSTIRKPMCILSQNAAQSITGASTDVPLTFGAGAEVIDTHGFHDESTNNTRITPSVPGWYTVGGIVFMASGVTYGTLTATIRANGASPLARTLQRVATIVGSRSIEITWPIQFNGTTDYVELLATHDGAASVNTGAAGSFASKFWVMYERPS